MKPCARGLDKYGGDDTSTGSVGSIRFSEGYVFVTKTVIGNPPRPIFLATSSGTLLLTSPHQSRYFGLVPKPRTDA